METLTKRSELLKIEKSQEKIEDNNPTQINHSKDNFKKNK